MAYLSVFGRFFYPWRRPSWGRVARTPYWATGSLLAAAVACSANAAEAPFQLESLVEATPTLTTPLTPPADASPTPAPVAASPGATASASGYQVMVARPQVRQGEVNWLRVEGKGITAVVGTWGEQSLRFAHVGGAYVGLVPVDADAPPGTQTIVLAISGLGRRPVTIPVYFNVSISSFEEEDVELTEETIGLLSLDTVTAENRYLAGFWDVYTEPPLWQGTFDLPVVGEVSSAFGSRRSYNHVPSSTRHAGIDFAVDAGTPVRAPARGRVILATDLTVRGRVVLLDHGMGVISGYFHLSYINVKSGQEVARGEVLGFVGSTGLSSGAHVHWEMRVNGVAVSPSYWVRQEVAHGG